MQQLCGSITQGGIRPTTGMKMLPPARAVRKPDRQGTGLAARIRSMPAPGDDPALGRQDRTDCSRADLR